MSLFLCALILIVPVTFATFGYFFLHPTRQPRGYDALLWIGAGLAMTWLVTGFELSGPVIDQVMGFNLGVIWICTFIGLALNGIALSTNTTQMATYGCICSLFGIFLCAPFLPPSNFAKRAARNLTCLNNIRNTGLGLLNYAVLSEGAFPAPQAGEPPRSWRVDILPYLDRGDLHVRYDQSAAWNHESNRPLGQVIIDVYTCPDTPEKNEVGFALTAFSMPLVPGGIFSRGSPPRNVRDIPDGASRTILLVESCSANLPWAEPRDVDAATMPVRIDADWNTKSPPSLLSSFHPRGVSVTMADGSLRLLSSQTSPAVLSQLLNAADGEPPPGDF